MQKRKRCYFFYQAPSKKRKEWSQIVGKSYITSSAKCSKVFTHQLTMNEKDPNNAVARHSSSTSSSIVRSSASSRVQVNSSTASFEQLNLCSFQSRTENWRPSRSQKAYSKLHLQWFSSQRLISCMVARFVLYDFSFNSNLTKISNWSMRCVQN